MHKIETDGEKSEKEKEKDERLETNPKISTGPEIFLLLCISQVKIKFVDALL